MEHGVTPKAYSKRTIKTEACVKGNAGMFCIIFYFLHFKNIHVII